MSRELEEVRADVDVDLKAENNRLRTDLGYLENLLADDRNEIQTYDQVNQAFTTDLQLCVMNILSEGVGVHHVNNVLSHVAQLC